MRAAGGSKVAVYAPPNHIRKVQLRRRVDLARKSNWATSTGEVAPLIKIPGKRQDPFAPERAAPVI